MKLIILTFSLIVTTLSLAQTKKSATLNVCSNLTDSELREKLILSEDSGISALYKEDDKNGGIKFKMTGTETMVSGGRAAVNTARRMRLMGPTMSSEINDLLDILGKPQQFFDMTRTKISNVSSDGRRAIMRVVIRPLPGIKRFTYNPRYNPRYNIKCAILHSTSRAKLGCVSIPPASKGDNFLIDKLSFQIENIGRTSFCDNKNANYETTVKVTYNTTINRADFNSFTNYLVKEMITDLDKVPSLVLKFLDPNEMAGDMMNPYFEQLYNNWAK